MTSFETTTFASISDNSTITPQHDEFIKIPFLKYLNIIILVISLYIFISLLIYGKRSGKLNWKLTTARLFIYCTTAIALGLPRLFVDIALFHVHPTVGTCERIGDASACLTGIAMIPVYVLLWYRQHIINSHEVVKANTPKCLRYFSFAVLGAIIVGIIFLFVLYVIPNTHFINQYGCVNILYGDDSFSKYFSFVIFAMLGCGQLGLLLLLIYPMYRIRSSNQVDGETPGRTSGSRDNITATMKRCLICFVIVICTDLLSSILTSIDVIPHAIVVTRTITNFEVMINQIALLATFEDFKFMICCSYNYHG